MVTLGHHSQWCQYFPQKGEIGSWGVERILTLFMIKQSVCGINISWRLLEKKTLRLKKKTKQRLRKTRFDKGSCEQPVDLRKKKEVLQMCIKEKGGVIFRRGWFSWEMVSCFHLCCLRRLLPSLALSAVKTQKGLPADSMGLCFGAWLRRQCSFLSLIALEIFVR